MIDDIDDEYGSWMADIQSRLEAFEGHGPPDNDELIFFARRSTGSCLGVIDALEDCDDEELRKEYIQTLKGDILEARVALEMERDIR